MSMPTRSLACISFLLSCRQMHWCICPIEQIYSKSVRATLIFHTHFFSLFSSSALSRSCDFSSCLTVSSCLHQHKTRLSSFPSIYPKPHKASMDLPPSQCIQCVIIYLIYDIIPSPSSMAWFALFCLPKPRSITHTHSQTWTDHLSFIPPPTPPR